jgi:hypothetical protein
VGEDDGGLSDALELIAIERASEDLTRELAAKNNRRERAMVEAALEKQSRKVRSAVRAFLARASEMGIEPTTILVGMRQPDAGAGPSKRLSFRRQRLPDPEPVFDRCFQLYRTEIYNSFVRIYTDGAVEFDSSFGRRWKKSVYEGSLPFHVDDDGEVFGGSVPTYAVDLQLEAIERTTSKFVAWLASYLSNPPSDVSQWDDEAERSKLYHDPDALRRALPAASREQRTRPLQALGPRYYHAVE